MNEMRNDKASGAVVKVGGRTADGKGYNPYRAAGKFASGPHKAKDKVGPAKVAAPSDGTAKAKKSVAPGAKTKTPKYQKFNDSYHKDTISAHKTVEMIHRTRSLKIAEHQRAIREQAKTLPKNDKKGRAELRSKHQILGEQRKEHQAKASEARAARIAESKAMQEARRQHVAGHVAAKQAQTGNKAPVDSPHPTAKAVQSDKPAKTATAQPAKAKSSEAAKPDQAKPFDQPVTPGSPMTDSHLTVAREHLRSVADANELSAAEIYSGHSYTQINHLLRTGYSGDKSYGPDSADNEVHFSIKHLDTLMAKVRVESPVVTYRGTDAHPSFTKLKPGQVFVDKAFMSTTTDIKAMASGGFDEGKYLFHITSPMGTKMAGIPSKYPEEKEMLLARGSALRLDRREVINGKHHMHFTVVGQE